LTVFAARIEDETALRTMQGGEAKGRARSYHPFSGEILADAKGLGAACMASSCLFGILGPIGSFDPREPSLDSLGASVAELTCLHASLLWTPGRRS
jgi:hypothetical protein